MSPFDALLSPRLAMFKLGIFKTEQLTADKLSGFIPLP
jgi:hypothetical protein